MGLNANLCGPQSLGVGVNSWALLGGPKAPPPPRLGDGEEALEHWGLGKLPLLLVGGVFPPPVHIPGSWGLALGWAGVIWL